MDYLHSHSALEREIRYPKRFVLVDEKFSDMFSDILPYLKKFNYKGQKYLQVPILTFVRKGGIFKNFDA